MPSELELLKTALHDVNGIDTLCKIKEKLQEISPDIYCKWKENDFNINHQFISNKYTLLYLAAYFGYKTTVKTLLEGGSDPNIQDKDGNTALHVAACNQHTGVVQVLLNQDTDINIQSEYGITPLYWAAHNGHKEIVRMLFDKGDVASKRDARANNLLHFAVEKGDTKRVVDLLNKGADPLLKNRFDKTPRNLARDKKMKQILKNAEKKRELHEEIDRAILYVIPMLAGALVSIILLPLLPIVGGIMLAISLLASTPSIVSFIQYLSFKPIDDKHLDSEGPVNSNKPSSKVCETRQGDNMMLMLKK